MSTLVSVQHVSLFLPGDAGQRKVLHKIDWNIASGRHCALQGANGAGKSTLLRLLAGELWPAEGRIFWYGPNGPEESPLVGRAMTALVSPALQERYQRRAWDQTGMDLLCTALPGKPRQQACAEELASRLHIGNILQEKISGLSQGQLRLLLLARALLQAPALLLLDEYLDGLDAFHRKVFAAVLEEYARQHTVIMSTHRSEQIPAWCCERRYMHKGYLLSKAPAIPRPTPTVSGPASDRGYRSTRQEQPLLQLKNVSVYIERKKILHQINWTMLPHENWHISGRNGSGKSTFLRLLAGDAFAAAGGSLRRWLPGQGGRTETLAAVRRGIHLVSELSQARYGYVLTALELVCTGIDNSVGLYRPFSAAERAEALEHMQFFFPEENRKNIAQLGQKPVWNLSTGQIRRLFLARALMGKPDILLLDEACSGMDEAARSLYLQLLDQLPAWGVQIVFVSHNQEDIPRCINRQAHMENGHLRIMI